MYPEHELSGPPPNRDGKEGICQTNGHILSTLLSCSNKDATSDSSYNWSYNLVKYFQDPSLGNRLVN